MSCGRRTHDDRDRGRRLHDADRGAGHGGGQLHLDRQLSGDSDNLGAVEPSTAAEKIAETVTTGKAQPAITTTAAERQRGRQCHVDGHRAPDGRL